MAYKMSKWKKSRPNRSNIQLKRVKVELKKIETNAIYP